MANQSQPTSSGPVIVWTQKNSTPIFHPAGAMVPSGHIRTVRSTFEMTQSTGLLKMEFGVRYSDDGITWGSPAVVGAQSLTANGQSLGTAFNDIGTNCKAHVYAQFGLMASNVSGSVVEIGVGVLHLDFEFA